MFSAKEVFNQMSLREKIAQMFLQYYQGYEDIPEKFKEMNRRNELGGFIYFSGNNVRDLTQLHKMSKKIQALASENKYNLPFLLTVDQEGGQLTAIFNETTIFPGNMTLGFANDQTLAYDQGRHVGKELKYAGINICYAPVLDVDFDAINGVPVVDNRKFSTKPSVVGNMGTAFIKGLNAEGILACGKHFPGMRITQVDTHFQMDRSPYDMKRLEEVEIAPFKHAIDHGLECIMTHHGIFDAIDADNPASLSKKAMTYLRKDLGFEGLVVTDDLIMKAILNEYGERKPIQMAINAGADLLITTCADDWFVDYVEEEVNKGTISSEKIDSAVKRILAYKERLFSEPMPEKKVFSKKEGDTLSKKIAMKGIILYKGEETQLPLNLENKKLGILFGNPARLVMSDATNLYDLSFKDVIREITGHENIKEVIMPWHPTHEEIISLADIGIISDIILFTTVNAYHFERQVDVLKEVRKYCPNKIIIGVASRSPMDAKILSEYCDYVIVTGGITNSIFEAVAECVFNGVSFEYNEAKSLEFIRR